MTDEQKKRLETLRAQTEWTDDERGELNDLEALEASENQGVKEEETPVQE